MSSIPRLGAPVPEMRVQRWKHARENLLDHLGFSVEWEYRFAPGFPLYQRLERDRARLDLP